MESTPAPHVSPVASSSKNSHAGLHVLVFKDNYAARSFTVKLPWIGQLGWIFLCLASISLLSTVFAIRFYVISRKTDPTYVVDLEQQVDQLRDEVKRIKREGSSTPSSGTATAPLADAPAASVTLTEDKELTPKPVETSPSTQAADQTSSALPQPNPEESSYRADGLPIDIVEPALSLRSGRLSLKFALSYTATSPGNQKGRLMVLARTTRGTAGYPQGVVGELTPLPKLLWDQGEYFSVNRYREATAEFDGIASLSEIKQVEILLFDLDGKLIALEKLKPSTTKQIKTYVAPKAVESAPAPEAPSTPSTNDEASE